MKIEPLILTTLLVIEGFLAIAIKWLFFENHDFIDYYAYAGCIMVGTIAGYIHNKIK